MLVICSLPMPVGTPAPQVICPLNLLFFSLFIFPSFHSMALQPQIRESINNVFLVIFSLSNDSLFNSTPRAVFPKSSSHTALTCKRHSAYITLSPSPAALKGANSKRHTSEEKLEFSQFLKTQCEKFILHVAY